MSCHQGRTRSTSTRPGAALVARGGGYEVVHSSPGLEIGVYVLVAPEPDRQQPHDEDEVYVVLEGSGVLEVEGTATALTEGMALFVAGGRRAPLHGVRAARRCSSSSTARIPAEGALDRRQRRTVVTGLPSVYTF